MAESNMHRVYVGLGSNMDDPAAQVEAGIEGLNALARTRVVRSSKLYRTRPVGYAEQPDFINAVAELETALAPERLLHELLALERRHGRVRAFRNGPRTLDLDLLLYDDCCLESPELTLPHPRMHQRAFVLAPLHEIAPEARIPGHGCVGTLLAGVDTRGVARCEAR